MHLANKPSSTILTHCVARPNSLSYARALRRKLNMASGYQCFKGTFFSLIFRSTEPFWLTTTTLPFTLVAEWEKSTTILAYSVLSSLSRLFAGTTYSIVSSLPLQFVLTTQFLASSVRYLPLYYSLLITSDSSVFTPSSSCCCSTSRRSSGPSIPSATEVLVLRKTMLSPGLDLGFGRNARSHCLP